MTPRILVAGIGNIFLGDDAFGVEVVRRLMERPQPEGVRLGDFGVRGFDLALALLDDAVDVAIFIDAVPRGGPPGTLYVIEPEWQDAREGSGSGTDASPALLDAHGLDPVKVLRLVVTLGGRPKPVLLVGCEPLPFDDWEDSSANMTMSSPVWAAVEEGVVLVESLIARVCEGREIGAAP